MKGSGCSFIETLLFTSPENIGQHNSPAPAEDVIAQALREDVAPVVYYLLKKGGSTHALASTDMHGLARLFETNMVFNLRLRWELVSVLTRFNEMGLPHILLKGIALAEFYYPSLSMRRMTDVDILVREQDLPGIDACLRELGYAPVDSDIGAAIQNPPGYLASLEYHRKEGLPPLHIHWRLVNTSVPATMFAPFQSMERLWSGSVPVEMDGIATRVLCPEHLLLHLCEHALRINHSFNRLILVYDIFTVIRQTGLAMNWDAIINEARSSHMDIFLYCGLEIVRYYAVDAVPEDVLVQIRPAGLTWGQRLFLYLQLKGLRIRGSSYLLYLSLNRGLYAKAAFIFRTFVPPRSIQQQRRREGPALATPRLYFLRVWEILRYLSGVMPKLLGRR